MITLKITSTYATHFGLHKTGICAYPSIFFFFFFVFFVVFFFLLLLLHSRCVLGGELPLADLADGTLHGVHHARRHVARGLHGLQRLQPVLLHAHLAVLVRYKTNEKKEGEET